MIVQEPYEGSLTLVRTYSDEGYKIQQDGTGDIYDEAIDPRSAGRTYTETDIPIDEEGEGDPEKILEIILAEDEV